MSWTIERRGRVAVVTMTTNPVNAQNRAFFADLHEAFDRLERDHAESPVVLTGTGARFSAGLDLGEHFPLTPPSLAEMIGEAREFVAAEVPFGSLAAALAQPAAEDPAAEPVPGSVMAMAVISSPEQALGIHFFFCSSLP